MIRNGKVLGLALVAVLAMCAVMASAANAEGEFEAESYPATVAGSGEGPQVFSFAKGVSVSCETSNFDGTLAEEDTELELSAEFGECEASFGVKVDVTMNGCKYVDTPIKKFMGDIWEVNTHLECPAGKKVELEGGPCTITIPPQMNAKSSAYEDDTTKPKKMTYLATVDKFVYFTHKKNAFCPLTEGEGEDGQYEGEGFLEGAEIG
jgi:hypothetical protein